MSRIGRYQVEREIGRGAMGIVYLARDPRLQRQLAVKVHSIPRGLSESDRRTFRKRFLHEAQAAAVLSHPGIVTVYDAVATMRPSCRDEGMNCSRKWDLNGA